MSQLTVSAPTINSQRLQQSLSDLGVIGAYTDPETQLQGVCRLALSAEDGQGRNWTTQRMRDLGLSIVVDRIGNVYATRAGQDSSLKPVMVGSHIDSVPTAGRFDGCLGVLGGLEMIATLNDHKVETLRPITVAFFTDEEGCRFGTDMLGSAVATGRLKLEDPIVEPFVVEQAGGAVDVQCQFKAIADAREVEAVDGSVVGIDQHQIALHEQVPLFGEQIDAVA